MNRFWLAAAVALALLGMTGCSLFGSKAEVYITVDTIGATLITVKFVEPADNAGSYKNEYGTYRTSVWAEGYSWYLYDVPGGEYDVYIEWTDGIGFNGRARITLDPDSALNQWAAVYPDTGGNVWAEQGGGPFSPGMLFGP